MSSKKVDRKDDTTTVAIGTGEGGEVGQAEITTKGTSEQLEQRKEQQKAINRALDEAINNIRGKNKNEKDSD